MVPPNLSGNEAARGRHYTGYKEELVRKHALRITWVCSGSARSR